MVAQASELSQRVGGAPQREAILSSQISGGGEGFSGG